jgi:type II secretory pathway pseudopilin PulG
MRSNQKGFGAVEVIIVLFVLLLVGVVGLFAYGRISARGKVAQDAETVENLEAARKLLSAAVTESKTIPDSLQTASGVSYQRKDNQTAQLCANFGAPRAASSDNFVSPTDVYRMFFNAKSSTYNVYRDNVDFAAHTNGRNCYVINYAPINDAYQEKYRGQKGAWSVCDAYRTYHARFTGQTIKGFVIGGPLTTSPGTAGGRAVLAQDIDAYDATCKKIPVSNLKVGDKVQMYIEDGPTSGGEKVYFVKAIKKEQ